jgi:hypothetical protein
MKLRWRWIGSGRAPARVGLGFAIGATNGGVSLIPGRHRSCFTSSWAIQGDLDG